MRTAMVAAGRRWSMLGVALLAGCAGAPLAADLDPFINGAPLPREPAAAATRQARAEVPPPLPATGGPAASPAALANGTAGFERRGAETAVTLGSPRGADRPAVTPTAATAPVAAAPTYEQLQQMLLARGVVWQQLRSVGERGEWHFVCAIPRPGQPSVRRNYEARAVGPYGLGAIRAALTDIDRDRQGGQ